MPQTGLNKTFKNASGGDNSLRYFIRILEKLTLTSYWPSELHTGFENQRSQYRF